jgi:hypothetical protein
VGSPHVVVGRYRNTTKPSFGPISRPRRASPAGRLKRSAEAPGIYSTKTPRPSVGVFLYVEFEEQQGVVWKADKSPLTILGFGGFCAGRCWLSLPVLALIRCHQILLNPRTGSSMVEPRPIAIRKTPKEVSGSFLAGRRRGNPPPMAATDPACPAGIGETDGFHSAGSSRVILIIRISGGCRASGYS